ncbi:MAG TPA: hypothetical protein VH092_23250 [Urbifossiella sp.]|nr:hypothetical protein [Urbifossiella sp.]
MLVIDADRDTAESLAEFPMSQSFAARWVTAAAPAVLVGLPRRFERVIGRLASV